MPTRESIEAVLDRFREPVDREMQAVLANHSEIPLYEMVRYHLGLDGNATPARTGKRVRAAMCMLCCAAAGGDAAEAAPAATAIEMLHGFTLLHDDVADEDIMRRGRPTVWRRWGVGQAVTAGDALYALANLAAMRITARGASADVAAGVLAEINSATLTICEGQQLDISYEGRSDVTVDDYLDMVGRKTAALFATSCAVGALVARAKEATREGLRRFGRKVGLAFQIVDDVLGVWGSAETLGKPVGSDLRRNKRSLPVIHALSAASDDDREDMLSQLAAGIQDDEEARKLSERMEQLGSRAFAEAMAHDALAEGLETLGGATLEPAAVSDLRLIARYLVERTE
jgi:geranylgeranyl diphosphate synthase type I